MVDTSPLEWRKGYGYVWKHFYDKERTKILADYKRYTQLYYQYVDTQDCLRFKPIRDNYIWIIREAKIDNFNDRQYATMLGQIEYWKKVCKEYEDLIC